MLIYIPKVEVRYQSINEILIIEENWNLIDREQFLAITWEPEFSQACYFSRMLKDHNNFHFTLFPDKTNDLIFLKYPNNLVFSHFLTISDIIFFKKVLLSHVIEYGSLTQH